MVEGDERPNARVEQPIDRRLARGIRSEQDGVGLQVERPPRDPAPLDTQLSVRRSPLRDRARPRGAEVDVDLLVGCALSFVVAPVSHHERRHVDDARVDVERREVWELNDLGLLRPPGRVSVK